MSKKTIERIQSGELDRGQLQQIRDNCKRLASKKPKETAEIMALIDQTMPSDKAIAFMGFCPGADFSRRQDIEWKEKQICEFHYYEDKTQTEDFMNICVGDLIVLKKIEKFGKTMMLFGKGRVTGMKYDDDDRRYLTMNWSNSEEQIEVPLMGCYKTVCIRDMKVVADHQSDDFFEWLEQ